MSTNHFKSPLMRLRRASENLSKLDKCVANYFKKQPYRKTVEHVPEENMDHHKVVLTKSFPERATNLAVEAIEGFRSSLDQAAYASACYAGREGSKFASFPIVANEEDLEVRIKGASKDLPEEAKEVIRSYKPFKEGNQSLFLLNELCNSNKHRLIVPVGMGTAGVKYQDMTISGTGSIPVPKWNKEKQELVFGSFQPGTEFKYNVEISFYAAFDASEASGLSVIDTMREIEEEVRNIIRDMRLGVTGGDD